MFPAARRNWTRELILLRFSFCRPDLIFLFRNRSCECCPPMWRRSSWLTKARLAREPREGIESTELDRLRSPLGTPWPWPSARPKAAPALSSPGLTLDMIVNRSFSDTPVELLK